MTKPLRSFSRLLLVKPFVNRGVLLLRLLARGNLRGRLQRFLLRLHVRLYLIQRIALSLSNPMHGEQMDLQVLLGLELLAAHVTRDVLGLHSVNVNNVLL